MSKKNGNKASNKGSNKKAVKTEAATKVDVELKAAEGSEGEDNDGEGSDLPEQSPTTEVTASTAAAREMTVGDVPAPKSLKIEKDRPASNGIKRPSIGGLCRAIWDKLDAIHQAGNPLPTAKELARSNNWNLSTCGRQSSEWRKFRGIGGKRSETEVEA